MASIEARLQQLEDRVAIQDLAAEYCRAIDDRDLEAFLETYTEDCVLRYKDGAMRIDGKPALREYYANRFKQYGLTFHYPHAHVITFDGPDQAHGWLSGHAEMGLSGEGWLAAFRYTDVYRRETAKEGMKWRFTERELAAWYYMKIADLPLGMGQTLRKHYHGELMAAELPESMGTYKAMHNL
jgi:uncharacterized protein (TIGR02246 family)